MKILQRQRQRGSTLIEVLVAMVIVSTVLTAIASMMAMSMRVSEANEMEQLAQMKAQEALEYMRKERLVRGWGTFYDFLAEQSYCLNSFPDSVADFSTLATDCAGPVDSFNNFNYSVETAITKPDLTTVAIEINVYRWDNNEVEPSKLNDGQAFFTLNQALQQY
jgi:prepilin-type N-terminal cleavage/methylation domain-containing protein